MKKSRSRPTGEYAFLQLVVGVIAILLAPVVALGDKFIDHHGLRGSISSYYYGRTGGYLVGSLCALGVFFLSYQHQPGPEFKADRRLSIAAFVFACTVALCPTTDDKATATAASKRLATVHIGAAALLFGLLAVFSLYEFTKTAGESAATKTTIARVQRMARTAPTHRSAMTRGKQHRNVVYRAAGWIIVACIVLIGLGNLTHHDVEFWLEAIAVTAFGISWLVKSEWIPVPYLGD